MSVSWPEVRTRRLERCGLLRREGTMLDAARAMCAVQAQVQVSGEIQLAIRCATSQDEVRTALWEQRSLVKAWTIRGTLHFHAADDFATWFSATRGERGALEEWRDPRGELHPALTAKQVDATHTALEAALADGPRTREELAAAVRPAVRSRVLAGFAFFTGDLVQGPPRGARVTLALPGVRLVSRGKARIEACRRFLYTYGPARATEMREWLGFDAPLDEVGVEEIEVEGRRTLVLAGDTEFPAPVPSVRLLPEYDGYVMASREREQLVPPKVREQVAAHGRGRYEGPAGVRFLMIDGVAAGLWERKKTAKRIEIAVTPAVRLTKAQRAEVEVEAERIARCFGAELSLSVTSVPRPAASSR
ncbi:MAG TPA: crosslink repair DNA glycosylase YcaQ family protein [Gaiellaceae bacterium]|nr:crosslink repair DNA glycosylase YcaQ family protein [Gaiellaceae bacterium]